MVEQRTANRGITIDDVDKIRPTSPATKINYQSLSLVPTALVTRQAGNRLPDCYRGF
jgi:hypothetical protein